MKMKAYLTLLTAATLTSVITLNCMAEMVELENKAGKTVKVKLLGFDGNTVSVKLKNGRKTKLKIDQLSEKTVQFLKDRKTKIESAAKNESKAVNKAIGHKLFSGPDALWETEAQVIAEILRWPVESQTKSSSSYRYYAPAKYGFLNARPYSAVLYANEEGKVSHLSLVYANKGDYNSSVGFAEDHFKPENDQLKEVESLEDAMDRDSLNIASVLTEALGKAVIQRYGEREGRGKVQRWDYKEHSFILSKVEGEYVRLLIVTKEVADQEGKQKFISDAKLKQELVKNLETNDFGDVYIDDIPMVNQGPKGYCAPATFERAMRYMRVPADMYVLATIATGSSGGTNTNKLADKAKLIIRSKARRIKEFESKEVTMRSVKKYISKGVPILWRMCSLEQYNEHANKRTRERISQTDPKAWKTELEAELEGKVKGLKEIQANHHICMIIGYNEKTQEIAVSDSWGPQYKMRWVHIDMINAVSNAGSFVIDL